MAAQAAVQGMPAMAPDAATAPDDDSFLGAPSSDWESAAWIFGYALAIWYVLGIIYWLAVGMWAGAQTPLPRVRKGLNAYFKPVYSSAFFVYRNWVRYGRG